MAGTCKACGRPGKKLPGGAHASCGGIALRAPGPLNTWRPSGYKRWSKVRATTLKGSKYARNHASVRGKVREADVVRALGTKELALWEATPRSHRKVIDGRPHVAVLRGGRPTFVPVRSLPSRKLTTVLGSTLKRKYARY